MTVLCVVMTAAAILLTIKLFAMGRALDDLGKSLKEKLGSDTNTVITTSSGDKAVRRLADELNVSLRELRAQRRRYVQGDSELKTAVTNISHDLRTPLTAIISYLDLLEEHPEKSEQYLPIIRERTEALTQLTEELFRYSVITSPDRDDPAEDIAVNNILEESILAYYAALQERGISPEIEMTENKVIRRVNSGALSRVFSNLLNNAMKYSDGDLKITLDDDCLITFQNSASAMSEVQVGRLFDRFYTIENARHSTGLGLSIARALIEQMNGTITAELDDGYLTIKIKL